MAQHGTLIAIVDDQESVRKALLRLLRLERFRAEAYASAAQLLESLETTAPDCIVLDLHMPGMTGLDLLHHFRASANPPAVVVITADDTQETERECLALGVTQYLRKPIDRQRLLDSVRAVT